MVEFFNKKNNNEKTRILLLYLSCGETLANYLFIYYIILKIMKRIIKLNIKNNVYIFYFHNKLHQYRNI